MCLKLSAKFVLISFLLTSCNLSEGIKIDKSDSKFIPPTEEELSFEEEPYENPELEVSESDFQEESDFESLNGKETELETEAREAEAAQKLAEEKRKAEQAAKLAKEKRKAEQAAKLAEENRKAEQAAKLAEENRKAEQAAKLAEEKRKAEQAAKLAEEKRKAEQAAKLAEERRSATEEGSKESNNVKFVFSARPKKNIYGDQTGLNKLIAEYGDSLPDGRNLKMGMLESRARGNRYTVGGLSKSVLDTKITYDTTLEKYLDNPSSHAKSVARRMVGFDSHIPKVEELYSFNAMNLRRTHFIHFVTKEINSPLPDIWNNSWVSYMGTGIENTYKAIDYLSNRYNVLFVAGLDNLTSYNASKTTFKEYVDKYDAGVGFPGAHQGRINLMLAHMYNGIVVGSTHGKHAIGEGVILNNTDRIIGRRSKPDIVGVKDYTSYSTPIVSSVAGLLKSKAKFTQDLKNAQINAVTKAILFSGATKDDLPEWHRTDIKPIDPHYGVGAVNSYNSYKILLAGEKNANKNSFHSDRGWDLGFAEGNQKNIYKVHIGENEDKDFSVALSWNRKVFYQDGYDDSSLVNFWKVQDVKLDNLNLYLYRVNNGQRVLIQKSVSEIDNLEHIYMKGLAAGKYEIIVENLNSSTEYGLAWRHGLLKE